MPIERPEWDAPYGVWQTYCDQLNAVAFSSADKMETGFLAIARVEK